MYFSVKQQGNPGDHIGAELEFDAVLLQHGNHVDTVAFHAGVHPVGMAAGLTIQVSAALTNGAGLRRQHVGVYPLRAHQVTHLIGDFLMLRTGGKGLIDIRISRTSTMVEIIRQLS